MKTKHVISSFLTVSMVAGLFTACQSNLKSQAKISETEARQIAMSQVPNGTIKEGELEKEKGHLIWSFDMAIPDSKDIKEVNIDAITGKVLAVDTENPAAQAKEKGEDAKEGK